MPGFDGYCCTVTSTLYHQYQGFVLKCGLYSVTCVMHNAFKCTLRIGGTYGLSLMLDNMIMHCVFLIIYWYTYIGQAHIPGVTNYMIIDQ